jgi:hypothetical protein
VWRAYTSPLTQLLRGVLAIDPAARLTIDEVLGHPWLAGEAEASPPGWLEDGLAKLVCSHTRGPGAAMAP